jgi:hypothetical protein
MKRRKKQELIGKPKGFKDMNIPARVFPSGGKALLGCERANKGVRWILEKFIAPSKQQQKGQTYSFQPSQEFAECGLKE